MDSLVKSKDRVKQFGEVFTPENIVEDMIGLVKDDIDDIEKTAMEPSCGNGNFLVKILEHKLNSCKRYVEQGETKYKERFIRAIASIYGIDIMVDNILEAQSRMMDIISRVYNQDIGKPMDKYFIRSIDKILEANIILGDFLSNKTDYKAIESAKVKIRHKNRNKAHNIESKEFLDELLIYEWDIRDSEIGYRAYTLTSMKNGENTVELEVEPMSIEEFSRNKLQRVSSVDISNLI